MAAPTGGARPANRPEPPMNSPPSRGTFPANRISGRAAFDVNAPHSLVFPLL